MHGSCMYVARKVVQSGYDGAGQGPASCEKEQDCPYCPYAGSARAISIPSSQHSVQRLTHSPPGLIDGFRRPSKLASDSLVRWKKKLPNRGDEHGSSATIDALLAQLARTRQRRPIRRRITIAALRRACRSEADVPPILRGQEDRTDQREKAMLCLLLCALTEPKRDRCPHPYQHLDFRPDTDGEPKDRWP